MARHLKETGSTAGFDRMVAFSEFEGVIEAHRYREIEARFAAKQAL